MNFAQVKSRRCKKSTTAVLSLKKALELLSRKGARLVFMYDNSAPSGKSYFIVPGGRVELETAKRLIERIDIAASGDGLFPGISQTWMMIR